MMIAQSITATVADVQHELGQLYTYLLSARIEGGKNAEPGPDGKIPVTIVPDDNNQAIMTSRILSPEEALELATDASGS